MAMNLLQNADFGGPTYSFQEWGHDMTATQVPDGWKLWYRGRAPEDPASGVWYRPEARVLRSQEQGKPPPLLYNLFTSYSTHGYALLQRVKVTLGKLATFSVYAWPWSAGDATWPQDSDPPGSYWVRCGIAPFGGEDPHSLDVVWSHGESGPNSCNNPQNGPQWTMWQQNPNPHIPNSP